MNGEQLPTPVGGSPELPKPAEAGPGRVERAPEQVHGGETREVAPAGPSEPAFQAPVIQAPPVSTPQPAAQSSTTDDTTQNPPIASDDDLIEKEWVARSKKIVNDTKGDPYQREVEVSKLRVDYKNKRWNKDAKLVSE